MYTAASVCPEKVPQQLKPLEKDTSGEADQYSNTRSATGPICHQSACSHSPTVREASSRMMGVHVLILLLQLFGEHSLRVYDVCCIGVRSTSYMSCHLSLSHFPLYFLPLSHSVDFAFTSLSTYAQQTLWITRTNFGVHLTASHRFAKTTLASSDTTRRLVHFAN